MTEQEGLASTDPEPLRSPLLRARVIPGSALRSTL
jgi:hypothetical protein